MSRGHAVRVAAVTTAAIAVVYVVCVVVLNLVVSARLTAQSDHRIGDRLSDLRKQGADLASGISAVDYDDDSPVAAWLVDARHRVIAQTPGTPPLPASLARYRGERQFATVTLGQYGPYRLVRTDDGPNLLVVGVSRAGDHRIERWLLVGEVTAGPVALLAMFAGSLLIGLRAQAPVEQARRRQLEFTADASHELRTPLSVIRAETDLALSAPRKPAEYRDTLTRIQGESERLRRLVEDMLWLARFDSQPPQPDEGPADLVTVARTVADRFRSAGPVITADCGPRPALIQASPEWTDRLAGVLLDNACRYAGPGGKVRVSVAAAGNRVTLTVEDSGPGIPAGQRSRLFDRFSRATEQKSGTGLGLAIGDSVVRSTGGRWEVGESPLGGARFEVSWRQAAASGSGEHAQPSACGPSPRPRP